MIIAGEASGDLLAAELVGALRDELTSIEGRPDPNYQPLHTSLEPRFFGAGGTRLAAAGVELAFDMTAHAVTGVSDVLINFLKFRRLFVTLYDLALKREPDAIICVDFSGFNRRFAHAIRAHTRTRRDWFHDWNPKIIQYVSPQVWASREGRAYQMAKDYDLVLSIFPFESEWYAKRVPQLKVEFVGHPLLDRYGTRRIPSTSSPNPQSVLLLPGSRPGELKRHLSVMVGAFEILRRDIPGLRARMVLPDDTLVQLVKAQGLPAEIQVQTGGLAEALKSAAVAIASTGTVTMECAFFGVPTVAMYRTSWTNFQIAKRLVHVNFLAMPNLLAQEEIFPEFIQSAATAENLARSALDLLRDEPRRQRIQKRLTDIVASLGPPGATHRAAQAIARLVEPSSLFEPRTTPSAA